MHHKTTIWWLSLVMTMTTFVGVTWTVGDKYLLNKKHHVKRQARQQTSLNQFDIRSMLPSQWTMYAPNPPNPDEVDCHIELEVTELIGGRCVRLGGYGNEEGPAVCQSGIHLDIWSNQCEGIMAAREANQNTQNSQQQQSGQSEPEISTSDTDKR